MIYYILPLGVFLFRKNQKFYLVLLIILAGMRSFIVGSDSKLYLNAFLTNGHPKFELGFNYLINIVRSFTENYKILFLIIALINISLYYYTLKRKDYKKLYLAIYLYITTYCYIEFNFNILRQGIALSIMFFATYFLEKKKMMHYIILVFLAIFFHKSSVIGFLILLLRKIKNKKICYIGLVVSILLSFTNILQILIEFIISNIDFLKFKYYSYLNSDFLNPDLKLTTIGLILIKILPFLFLKFFIKEQFEKEERMYLIYIMFEILSAKYLVVRRLNIYLIIYVIYYTMNKIERVNLKWKEYIIILYYYIVYSLFLYQNFARVIPYSY